MQPRDQNFNTHFFGLKGLLSKAEAKKYVNPGITAVRQEGNSKTNGTPF